MIRGDFAKKAKVAKPQRRFWAQGKKSKTTLCKIYVQHCNVLECCDVLEREVKKVVQHIFDFMKKTLQAFPNLVTKEEVRRKVMVDPFVIKLVSNFGIIFFNAITKRNLMTRLVQYFQKLKGLTLQPS